MTRATRAKHLGAALAAALAAALPASATEADVAAGGSTLERIVGTNALAEADAPLAATLVVRPDGPRAAHFDMYATHAGRLVRAYDIDMTQREHLVLIGADFRAFLHVHPAFEPDGHFRSYVRVPRPGRYYAYADTEPHGFGRQVFRFAVSFGHAPVARPNTRPTSRTLRSGAYSVSLGSLTVPAGRSSALTVAIAKFGRPARDLRPYLGVAAHAVFISTTTLAYIHVHPVIEDARLVSKGSPTPADTQRPAGRSTPADKMSGTTPAGTTMRGTSTRSGAMKAMTMAMMSMPHDAPLRGGHVPATFNLHVPPTPAGVYKLWLQFRGADGLHVAPFVLTAR